MARYSPSAVWAIESEISCSIAGSSEIARRRCSRRVGHDDRPPESLARVLGQQHGVAGDAGAIAHDLDDGAEVADRDALAQQGLQDALDLADGEQVGHYFLNDSRVGFLEPVEQRANVLSREQIGDVAADRLGEVGDDDRLGVDHRVAQRLGLGPGGVGDPHRGQAEGRLGGRDAGELADRVARVQRELVAGHDRAAGDLVPRTFITYSCEPSATSSWMRTGGMIVPRSAATWRRTAPTRASSEPPAPPSTSGTRPKPIDSSSGVDGQRLEGLVARGRRGGQGGRGRLLRLGGLALGQHAGDARARPGRRGRR